MGRVKLIIKPRAEMEFSYPEKEAGKKNLTLTTERSCSILKATLEVDGKQKIPQSPGLD